MMDTKQFRTELQALIGRFITPASTFADYCMVTAELERAKVQLDVASNKFSDAEVEATAQ